MATFNFSKLISVFMPCSYYQNDLTYAVRALLSLVLNKGVKNDSGEDYTITPSYAQEWYNETMDMFPNIKKGVAFNFEDDLYNKDFDDFITENVSSAFVQNFYDGLLEAARNDANFSESNLEKVENAYKEEKYDEFFRLCYLHALSSQNKFYDRKRKRVENYADIYSSLVGHRPDSIEIPQEIAESELPYVNELLAVYSEKESTSISTVEELVEYPSSLSDLETHRKYYYAAESIRVGIRDTELKGTNAFEDFKDEVEEVVVPITRRSFKSGEKRLNKAMEEVTKPNYGSALPKFTDWIRVSEKRGVCHMLVNDGKIKWVKKDE